MDNQQDVEEAGYLTTREAFDNPVIGDVVEFFSSDWRAAYEVIDIVQTVIVFRKRLDMDHVDQVEPAISHLMTEVRETPEAQPPPTKPPEIQETGYVQRIRELHQNPPPEAGFSIPSDPSTVPSSLSRAEEESPTPLPPEPEFAKLADYGEVGEEAEGDPGPVDVTEKLPDEPDRAALLRLSRKYKRRINFLNNKSLDQTIEAEERIELAALYERYHELAERGIRS